MVRKTREEALATREELLDAAERVFRKRGVGHTSLAEVADEAGVTRGAIYWHFRDKADLFQALVKRVEMPMSVAMEEMDNASAADPLGAVRTLAVHALQSLAGCRRTQAVFDVVFLRCEYTEELAPVRARQLEDRKHCLRSCEAAFDQAVAQRQLPADTDTHVAAQGLYAFVTGLMRSWVETPARFDLRATAPALIDVYLAGLRANPPRRAAAPRKPVAKPAQRGDRRRRPIASPAANHRRPVR
jgi:TetR/AcrR family acrAB operon transcriptional repressor